ncbi:predicted protein [Lichtheimia corymbifera JMRC:FSU:9682]|uniref:Uncharacterized protein n=1 Tax=Lichtheimia corymbifera JMRC:FSU:9682 TaxID=1263082 RepID=A0A068SC82_9FUNG|nr:predicted protein [Lichtheimia corymbifera JMRC:FSU:9682]
MSRLILLKTDIVNLVVNAVIGKHATDKYKAVPIDWPNRMKSDVECEPASHRDRDLPQVLTEIQHDVDMKLYRRINEYCLQMIKQYGMPPVFPYNRARLGMSYVCVTYDLSSVFLDTTEDASMTERASRVIADVESRFNTVIDMLDTDDTNAKKRALDHLKEGVVIARA